jgi:hypothetical protein
VMIPKRIKEKSFGTFVIFELRAGAWSEMTSKFSMLTTTAVCRSRRRPSWLREKNEFRNNFFRRVVTIGAVYQAEDLRSMPYTLSESMNFDREKHSVYTRIEKTNIQQNDMTDNKHNV